MNTILTLSIENEVAMEAQKYAKEKGQSLSKMVENYLKKMTRVEKKKSSKELYSEFEKFRGIIKVNEDLNYNDILTEELSKKYGV